VGPIGQSNLIQTSIVDLTIDAETGQPTFQDLISTIITTQGGNIMFWASFAASIVTPDIGPDLPGEIDFQITVDGNPVRGAGMYEAPPSNSPQAGAIVGRVPPQSVLNLPAGPHIVALQWRVTNGQQAQCRPRSQPGREHATVTILESLV
jgi:hypothetical protein